MYGLPTIVVPTSLVYVSYHALRPLTKKRRILFVLSTFDVLLRDYELNKFDNFIHSSTTTTTTTTTIRFVILTCLRTVTWTLHSSAKLQ